MNWLNKLPGCERSPSGLEWRLWKRLPTLLAWGTAVPLLAMLVLWWLGPDASALAVEPAYLLWRFQLIGLVVLYWTLVLTLAIGCVIVILMKGPAYVADAYPLPERDQPAEAPRQDAWLREDPRA